MPSLSWKHQSLIQALLTRGPLKENDFHEIFSAVTGKSPGAHQELFNEYLLKINRELSSCQFELRGCRNQYDGHVFYGVVNNVADEHSKLGTRYSIPQIAFYKGIVSLVVNSYSLKQIIAFTHVGFQIEAIAQDVMAQGSISNIDALNIRLENQVLSGMGSQLQNGVHVPSAFRNFTMSQKEKTLDDLVQDKWLNYIDDGKIGLGVRSFLDLRSWFRSLDIASCELCNEAVLKGELCQSEGCLARIHHYCLKKKFSQKMGAVVCPSCGMQWQLEAPKEPLEEANGLNQSEQPEVVRSKRKRLRNADVDGSSSQTFISSSDTKRVTRSSTRQIKASNSLSRDELAKSHRCNPSVNFIL
ncbi:uncharacterized protein LOC123197305 isoform X2 [Mangifera indica]|uniref:uncharacterized protein LOC123197305 isoform X2 n=1 Tax=Mangifera indica TaxID=29780 RepID=UPI001CFC15F2|nr:uncharacterized protein LOC123197305 isoform X2 [Mangifera indica]